MHISTRKKWLIPWLAALLVLALLVPVVGCGPEGEVTPEVPGGTAATETPATAKYIFLFIGDGMGMPQRSSAEIYLASTKAGAASELAPGTKLVMNTFPAQGMCTTYAADRVITGSAAAGTALACGYKTNIGVISMDPAKTTKFKTIAEMAKERGMKVGIITSVSIDHATPAVFYAHQPSRGNYYEIAVEMANSGFDYFAGGGPKGNLTKKRKERPDMIPIARANGFTVAQNKAEFEVLKPGVGKVMAFDEYLDGACALYYELERPADSVSLAEYTKKGIELLDNPKGFFMMVEGGKIDWACHANDAAPAIKDTLVFDAAVNEAVKFYKKYPDDTLIVVTGDHECGGMTIGFAGTHYESFFEKIQPQKISYIEFNKKLAAYKESHTPDNARFKDIIPIIEDVYGVFILPSEERAQLEAKAKAGDKAAEKKLGMTLTDFELETLEDAFQMSMKGKEIRPKDEQTYLLYGGYEPFTVTMTHILNQKAGIAWTSYSHTAVPVPVSAIGVGYGAFNGYYDNTDVAKKMMSIAGFK
jgi:Alkaline phosphatase